MDDALPERTHDTSVALADRAEIVDQGLALPCARRGHIDDERDEFGREAVKHGGREASGRSEGQRWPRLCRCARLLVL